MIGMGSSGGSTTVLDRLTDMVSAKFVEGKQSCGKPKFCNTAAADSGACGNHDRILLDGLGGSTIGANGQGGSSGSICKSDLKAPKF